MEKRSRDEQGKETQVERGFLESLVDTTQVLIVVLDTEGRIVFFNRACQETTGYSAEEVLGRNWFELFLPKRAKEGASEIFQRLLEGQLPSHYESPILTQDGQERLIAWDNTLLYDGRGTVRHVVGTGRDITEHKRAEEELKSSEERLEILFEFAPDAYYLNDLKGNFVDGNRAAEEITGYKREELIGQNFLKLKLLPPEQIPKAAAHLAKNVLGRPTGPDEFVLNRKDGDQVAVEIRTFPVKIKGQSLVLGIARDITGRKQAEKALQKAHDALERQVEERTAELAIANEQLKREIEERQRAEEELGESERRFRDVAENAWEWIWEIDANGKYTYASHVVEKILGYKPEEILKKHFYDLFHPEDREELKKAAFEVFAQKQSFREFVNRNVHKNGSIVWLSTSGVPILDEKGNLLGYRGADTDITERKQAEEARARQNRELVALHAVMGMVSQSLRLEEVAQQAADLIHQHLGYTNVALLLVDEKTNELYVKAACGYPKDMQNLRIKIGQEGITGWVATHREPLLVPDVRQDPRYVMGAEEIRSELAVPVMLGEELLGVLDVESDRVAAFGEDDLRTLTTLAGQIAVAIENARLFTKEHQRALQLEALSEVSRVVSATLDRDAVLQLVLEQLARVVPYDSIALWLRFGDMLYVAAAGGFPNMEEILQLSVKVEDNSLFQAIEREKSPLIIADTHQDSRFLAFGKTDYVRSWIGVPLMVKDKVIGTITLDKWEPHFYHEGHAQMAVTFANQAAIAIQNARLYQAERKRAAQLTVVNQVARQAASILDLDQLLQEIVTAIQQGFDYYNVALFLLDEAAGELKMRAMAGGFEDMAAPGYCQAVGLGMIGWAAETGQPLLANDVSQEPRYILGFLEEPLTKAELCLPLRLADQIIGVLDVQDTQLNAFDEAHLLAMETLADQMAVAIENARLFEETKRRFEETTALYQTSLDITAQLEMSELLKSIVERAVTLLRAEAGGIYLYDPEREELRLTIGYDYTEKHVGTTLKLGEGMAGKVLQTGEPLIVDNYQAWAGRASVYEADRPFTAALEVPLKWQDQIIGVLAINADVQKRTFNQDDVWLATLFANQAAIAIENARSYEEERKRATQLELIGGITQKIASILDPDELLSQVVRMIEDTFGYYYAGILLVEAGSDELVMRAVAGPSVETLVGRMRLKIGQEGISGWVAHSGQPLLVNDVSREPRHYSVEESKDTQSELAVPIKLKGEIIGVLDVQSVELDAFSQDDVSILQTLADQLAVAIENAWLYEAEAQRRQEAETLRQAAMALTSTLNLEEALDRILEQLHRVVAYDSASVQLLRDGHLEIVGGRGFADPAAIIGLRFPVPSDNPNTHVIESGEPVILPDAQAAHAPFREPPHDHIRSWLGVPMRFRERIIGLITLDSTELGHFTADHARLAAAFANQAAVAIENARLYEEERRRLQELRVLVETSASLSSTLDINEILKSVTEQMAKAVDVHGCAISDWDEQKGVVKTIAEFSRATWAHGEGASYDLEGYPATTKALRTGQPLTIRVSDLAADESERALLQEWGMKSLLLLPLQAKGAVLGAVELYDAARERQFTEDEIALCQNLANQAAIAIQKVRLRGEAIEEAVSGIAEQIMKAVDVHECVISDWDEQKGVVKTIAEFSRATWAHGEGASYDLEGYPATTKALRTGQPLTIRVSDPAINENERALLQEWGMKSLLLLPLQAKGAVMGIVELYDAMLERQFTDDEMALCQSLANQAAIAIQNARLYEETQQRADEMAILYDTALDVAAKLDTRQLLQTIVERATDLLNATSGALYLYRPEQDDLELVLTYKLEPDFTGTVLQRGEGLSGKVLESGEPMIVDCYREWAGRSPSYEGVPFQAVIAVPVRWGEQILGIVNVIRKREAEAFDDQDVRLLTLFANQAAMAIENARLYEAEAQRRQEAETLREAALALTTSLDRNQVIERILIQLQQVVPYDTASIQLLQGDHLEIVGGHGFLDLQGVLGVSFSVDRDSPNSEVVRTQAPLILEDAPAVYETFRRIPRARHIRSWLGVPMLVGKRLVGMIALDKRELAFYTEEHARLAQAFAAQAAVAIENARLYEQITAMAAELEIRVQARTAELTHKTQELSSLYQASVALSSSLEIQEVLKALAQQAMLAVDAIDCIIFELQNDALVVVAEYWDPALPWKDPEIGRRYPLADYPATRQAIEKRQPLRVRVGDPLADETERAELQKLGYTALLQVHVVSRDQVVGVVEVFDNKLEREFSGDDIALLQTIANQAGLAIERARLFQQVREERNRLELLYEVSRKLSASLDLEQTLQDVFQVSVAATGASRGSIFVFDDEGRVSHRILMRDLSPVEADDAIDRVLCKGLAGWVLEQKQPAIVFDTSQDERWLPFSDDLEPTGSAMAIPFIERDRARGLLTLVHPQSYHFNQTHLELLSSIAHQVAVVIERARLHEHARRRAVQLATAAEVSRDATSTLDVDQLLARTVDLIRDRFDLYYAGIFLVDEAGEYAVLQAGTGEAGQQMLKQGHKLQVGGTSMVGQCVANAQACIALDVGKEAIRFDNPLLPETRTEAALPLISRGRVIGAMTIQSDQPAAFSDEDVAALQTLGDQLANAIENAWLYEETRRRAQEVARQKEQTDAIVQSMADGLIVTDLENRLILANPAAEELLKFSLKDAIGQDIGANIRDDRLRQTVRDTLDKQQPGYEVDIELTEPYDGARRIMRAHTAVVNDTDGQPVGIVTTLRDVTHEREVQRLKDELVSTVSHELRTPMTSVLGFSELLLTRKLSEEKRQLYVQTIHKEAQRLSALINDFLDIQRMEKGQQEYHFEAVDLGELAREMIATYSGQSEAHNLTLDLSPDLPLVQADPARLRQVFGNLFSNAIKFSPSGGTVSASVQVEGDEIRVAVSDEGIGIPAEAMPHLFEKFFRVDSSDRREIMGTGLGLAICKGIVEAHGGRIWAESQEGVGTTIIFSLPMVTRKRILFIDDEKDIREMFQMLLSEKNYEVLTAANGQEGLSLMEEELPDLLILDVSMPVMNGYQFLEKVRGDRRTKDIPVIVISGVDTDTDRLEELETEEFLGKPFSSTILLETMQRLLTRS